MLVSCEPWITNYSDHDTIKYGSNTQCALCLLRFALFFFFFFMAIDKISRVIAIYERLLLFVKKASHAFLNFALRIEDAEALFKLRLYSHAMFAHIAIGPLQSTHCIHWSLFIQKVFIGVSMWTYFDGYRKNAPPIQLQSLQVSVRGHISVTHILQCLSILNAKCC